ncbi:MAG: hypothetical protein AAGK21_00590 [Bacteroidota bacterium]
MGQQQLLLLVLGIVIVGISVVVALQVFERSEKVQNADALVNTAVRLAADVQAWSLKAPVMGGGGGVFTGASFAAMGYPDGDYDHPEGTFTLTVDNAGQVTLVGCNSRLGNEVTSVVTGIDPDEIDTTVSVDGC